MTFKSIQIRRKLKLVFIFSLESGSHYFVIYTFTALLCFAVKVVCSCLSLGASYKPVALDFFNPLPPESTCNLFSSYGNICLFPVHMAYSMQL